MNDKEVLKIVLNKRGRINSNLIRHNYKTLKENYKEIYNYLIHRYKDGPQDISTIIRRIKDKIEKWPLCKTCGKPIKDYTLTYCCNRCAQIDKDTIQKGYNTKLKNRPNDPYNVAKVKETCLKNYGVDNIRKSKEIIDKIKDIKKENASKDSEYFTKISNKCKNTKLLRYNNATFNNTEKSKQTKLNNHGDPNYNNREKAEQTCLDKYGENNPSKNKEIINKISDTIYNKFGEKWFPLTDKYRETAHKKYCFNNINFASFDEVCFYIYNVEYQNIIKKEPLALLYNFKGEIHKYFPDFEVNGKLYEIKGKHFLDKKTGKWINPFRDPNWTDEEYQESCELYEAKHQCAIKNNVIILYDCSKYIKYVENKYGKDMRNKCKKK